MSNWVSLPDIPTTRFDCGRVTLPNGDVLVFAGHDASNNTLTSSELLDHDTQTWSTVGPVATGRLVPGVILLNNGKVLTFGGSLHTGTDIATATCEIYDPVAKTWSATGSMVTGRYLMANFLLADGTVLAAGGRTSPGNDISTAEIYDPNTEIWTSTGSLPNAYFGMFYKTLGDGRPIVVGAIAGLLADPSQTATFSSGTWTQQDDFPIAVNAYSNSSAVLSNGDFIVMCPLANSGAFLAVNNNYIYSQISDTWSTHDGPGTAHSSTPARLSSTQILLPGGVLGVNPFVYTNICDIYDENADTWTSTDSLPVAGVCATQTEYTAPLLSSTTPLWVGAFSDIAINPTPYIYVSEIPVITSASTASGTTGTPFSYQITATNNPASFDATGLPLSLSVNTSTGLISGTPLYAGISNITLDATNAGGTGTSPLTLTIQGAPMPNPTSGILDSYNLRYNWGTAQLEMNTGGETWIGVPANLTDLGLTTGKILIGVSGVATAVTPSGDWTIATSGAATLATVNSNVGAFTSANITVDAKGRITAAANGSGGSQVLPQVVFATAATAASVTSNAFTAVGPTASITLQKSSNKVKITTCGTLFNTTAGNPGTVTIKRGSTDIGGAAGLGLFYDNGANGQPLVPVTLVTVDAPGDTSSHTYQLFIKSANNTNIVQYMAGNTTASITLEEILT